MIKRLLRRLGLQLCKREVMGLVVALRGCERIFLEYASIHRSKYPETTETREKTRVNTEHARMCRQVIATVQNWYGDNDIEIQRRANVNGI